VPELTYSDFLLDEALDRHKEIALIDSSTGEKYTYGKLKEKVNDMAIQFYIRSWIQGETLALIMPNKWICPITVLGSIKVGIPVTLVNYKYKSREMVKQLKATKVAYIVTTQKLLPYVRDATAALRGIKEILVLDKEEEEGEKKEIRWSIEMKYNLLLGKPPGWGALPDWEISPNATCLLPFTDGGLKGAALTHRNLSASLLQLSQTLNITKDDTFLTAMPYTNIFNLLIANIPWFKGAKNVLMEEYEFERFLQVVQEYQVTMSVVEASALSDLATSPLVEKHDLNSLHTLITPDEVETSVLEQLKKRLPRLTIKMGYGLKFLSPPILLPPKDKQPKLGSVGTLLPNMEAKILHPQTKEELGVGAQGHLWVKGPQMFKEFYNNIEANNEGVSEGFIKTGDLAQVDKDGDWNITICKEIED